MTGTEAISNGVPAFRPPEARNAAVTLICLAIGYPVAYMLTFASPRSLLRRLYIMYP